MSYQLHIGDSLDVLKTIPSNSIDSVVTDPPYGLEFMGKAWDKYTPGDFQNWCEQWATECLRVLKPGGHLVAFGGTRTYHRLASGIEDAGFEIRDKLDWIYGSGFPKSLDVSKAIDKAAGAERANRDGTGDHEGTVDFGMKNRCPNCSKPYFSANPCTCPRADKVAVTDAAKQWEGWGTALKPAHEPIVLARKPLDARPLTTVHLGIKTNNTVAANVLEHGTGGLNIDGCRVAGNVPHTIQGQSANAGQLYGADQRDQREFIPNDAGRWPPNILLSHSPYCTNLRQRRIEDPASWDCSEGCPVAEMDRQSGIQKDGVAVQRNRSGDKPASVYGQYGTTTDDQGYGGVGGASRFFPILEWDCAPDCPVAEMDRQSGDVKSSHTIKYQSPGGQNKQIYGKGLGQYMPGDVSPGYNDTGGASRFFPVIERDAISDDPGFRYQAKAAKKERPTVEGVAAHPTVKPVALMRWLAKLVTPPGGKVLDLFGGSGTTAEACELEGFDCTIIEREPDYAKLINARMAKYDTPKEVA